MQKAVVLLTLCGLLRTAVAEPEVGVVNAARDQARGEKTVAALRSQLAANPAYRLVDDLTVRAALEAALAPDDAMSQARSAIATAERKAFDLDHDAAATALESAERSLTASPPGSQVTAALAEIQLLRGRIAAARGDRQQAQRSFRLAARLAPTRKALDPGRYPPSVVKLYAAAVAPARGKPARLAVSATPKDAAVWVDGIVVGSAAAAIEVEPGDHYVTLVDDGFRPKTVRITGQAGKTVRVAVELESAAEGDRVRTIRAALIAQADPAWLESAKKLASVTELGLLVLVRQDSAGAMQAALYDSEANTLSPWAEPAALPLRASPAPQTATASSAASPTILTQSIAPEPRDRRAWYQTGWGRGLLIVAVAAAVGTTVLITTLDGEETYAVGNWSF
ncbi:MAG: PEGA domain-containing protein [Myxococcota bacterium]